MFVGMQLIDHSLETAVINSFVRSEFDIGR